jgi:hypothetical protein
MEINEEASGIISNLFMNEDHSKGLLTDLAPSLAKFEDYRANIKDIVKADYPEQMKDFVKTFNNIDKAISGLEKFLKKL